MTSITRCLLSALFPCAAPLQRRGVPQVIRGKPNFVCFNRFEFWGKFHTHTTCGILLLVLVLHEQINGAFEPFVDEIDLARIALLSFCS